jgi:hypothetical protein
VLCAHQCYGPPPRNCGYGVRCALLRAKTSRDRVGNMRRLQVLAGIASAGLVAASLVMGAPSGAGASAIPARAATPTPAHLWHAEGNADDSVGADNGTLVGAGFGHGVLGPDQALSLIQISRCRR